MEGKNRKRTVTLLFVLLIILIPLISPITTELAKGQQTDDQISISFDPRPNEPPSAPVNPDPPNGSVDVGIPVTLSVDVYDESSNTVDVYFYNASNDALIGVDYNVYADWSTATVIWSGLQYETSYSWYAVANDSEYEDTSETWTFTTRPNQPSIIYNNEYPQNTSTNIESNVICHIEVSDEDADLMTIYWYENSTGSWILRQTNSSVGNGTYYWTFSQASSYSTTYYWKVAVNDSIANTTAVYYFTTKPQPSDPQPSPPPTYYGAGSEDDPPTISNIYLELTKVTSYDPVYVYANITDDYSIKSVTLYWNDGSDHSKSMELQDEDGNIYYAQIGPFPDGITVTYSIEATDYCGASHTIQSGTKSFTVVAGLITIVIGNISSGETREITVGKLDGIDIDSINFTPTIDLTNVKMTIEKLADIPEDITTAPTGTKFIYTYINIEFTADNESIGEDEIKSLVIIFKVNLTWITENNIDKETITSMRYCGNEWHNLTTTILFNKDETYIYCKVRTNGMSTFVIFADEVIELLGPGEEKIQLLLLIVLIASITTIILTATATSIHKRRQIYYMRNKLNNVHNIELEVDELLSGLDSKNNKEIKKEKLEQSLRKRRQQKTRGKQRNKQRK